MRRTVLLVMLAALVGALVAVPIAVYASHQFTDVPDTNPFHADIDWLADSGITLGCGGSSFCPKDNVTREQMAAFMHRQGAIRNYELVSFASPANTSTAFQLESVPCPAGKVAIAGGVGLAGGNGQGQAIQLSSPETDEFGSSWVGKMTETVPTDVMWGVNVWAICANVD